MSALSQVLADLQKSVSSSETWRPTISIPTPHFKTCPISSKVMCCYNSTHNIGSIDVIQLLHQLQKNPPDPLLTSFLEQHLQYPKSAGFEIHGYVGLQFSKQVLDIVKTSALEGGTFLTSIRFNGTTNKT